MSGAMSILMGCCVFSSHSFLTHPLKPNTENYRKEYRKGHIFVIFWEICFLELTFDPGLYGVVRHRQNDRLVGVFFSKKYVKNDDADR
jgi:hypothetical protein